MQIDVTRKFQKQVIECNDRRIKMKVSEVIEEVIAAENMIGFKNLKKLTGHKNYFRIRLGNYRIGLSIENNVVIFAAFNHRSEIYKYFP